MERALETLVTKGDEGKCVCNDGSVARSWSRLQRACLWCDHFVLHRKSMRLTQVPIAYKILPVRTYAVQGEFVRPLTDDELLAELMTADDVMDSVELWDRASRLVGYLSGAPVNTDTTLVQHAKDKQVEYYYDFTKGIYRYVVGGRKVPDSRLAGGLIRVSNSSRQALKDLTQRLVDGEISKDYWYRQMRKQLKDEYRASWIASIGGVDNYDRSQAAKFGRASAPQYRWLNNFLDQMNSGEQLMNGSAVQRAGMYSRAGNGMFRNNQLRIAANNGMTKARRRLGVTDNHCHNGKNRYGCVELANMGWQDINLIAQIGDASCYSHCLCSYEFK